MDVLLIGGLWLTSDVWGDVVAALEARGHRGIAVSLPGQDDQDKNVTLETQLKAVLDAAEGAEKPLIVGHSAAATLAWMAADARVDQTSGVVFIGGFPESDGSAYADFFEPADGWMGFPGWETFEGPDSADLSEEQKERTQRAMVGVPEGVSRGTVTLKNGGRYALPVTVICPEFGPADVQEALDGGDAAELASISDVSLLDLDSGHWPMITCPDRLADQLSEIAEKSLSKSN